MLEAQKRGCNVAGDLDNKASNASDEPGNRITDERLDDVVEDTQGALHRYCH